LREKAPLSLLETYDGVSRSRWQQLFGMESGPTARTAANPWAKQHCAKFLPCIPASGENLAPLLSQLGLDFQSM
jgi:hypothetical protein